jgi:hypothetical protein
MEMPMKISVELVERFHEKWKLNKRSGCWEWTASVAGKGYGQIKLPGERRQIYAHRLSYLIHYGHLADDLLICHTCDNPKCVKPSHLFVGTPADNLQDMKAKDRHLHGTRNKKSKLSDDQVRHAHRLSAEGMSQGKIAKVLNVAQSTVFKLLKGDRYQGIYREIKAAAE